MTLQIVRSRIIICYGIYNGYWLRNCIFFYFKGAICFSYVLVLLTVVPRNTDKINASFEFNESHCLTGNNANVLPLERRL